MKFTVEKLPQAKAEIDSLEQSQKEMLEADYKKIQEQGIEFVRVKPIQKEIFEIIKDYININNRFDIDELM